MAFTASLNESFSNPFSDADSPPVQGNMMGSTTSLDAFEVVTPVLKTAEVLIEVDPKLKNETITEALSENKADTTKATALKTCGEGGMTEKAIEVGESNEGGMVEEAITKAAPGTLAERKTIYVNGDRYVEVSDRTYLVYHLTIDGIRYILEDAPKLRITAYDLLESAAFTENKDLSQEEISHASFNFRGHPIMIHVGTQSYAVHAPVMIKSDVLGSVPLEEAEDGSYSINLAEEDPIQFERLLTYMYQGTWEPERCPGGGPAGCWGCDVCDGSINRRYMQLYATACKYAVHGLVGKIASNLILEQDVLEFCSAFKSAYEMYPGSDMRSLFRGKLVRVFENTLRKSVEAVKHGSWGDSYKSGGLASALAQLVSCGGDFAVDLMQAFAAAQESAYRAGLQTNQQDPGNHDGWGDQTVEGSNDRATANNGGYHWPDQDAGCWVNTAQAKNDKRQCIMTPAKVPGGLAIGEDVEKIEIRLHDLEDMVSNLQLIAENSVQTQQPAFQQPLHGIAQGHISSGWGPIPSVPAKASWFQTNSGVPQY